MGNYLNQKRAVNLPAKKFDSGMVSPAHFDHEKLDVYQLGLASLDRIQAGKERLVRIVAMLTKLLMRFDPEQYRVHESPAGLAKLGPSSTSTTTSTIDHESKAILENPRRKTRF